MGVLWRSFVSVDWKAIVCVGSVYLLLVSLFPFIIKKNMLKKEQLMGNMDVFVSVFVLALLFGIIRFQIADVPAPAIFEAQVGKTVSFSALVVDEPARNASQVKLIVKTEGAVRAVPVKNGLYDNVRTFATSSETNTGGRGTSDVIVTSTNSAVSKDIPKTGIVIFSKNDLEFHYGDEINVSGKLEKPANFMTDQDMEFDYVNYLRKDGIYYTMKNPKIEILSSGHGNPIKRVMFFWKEKFNEAIGKVVPAPESTVLDGIILGDRYAFSQQLRQIFMDTGTIHIVTIGGYHVTLVAQWIMEIFGFLPKFAGIGTGIASIFLYVIATGGAQTSIRAGIMATLALFASATGRMYDSGRALVLAAIIMILINPFVLAYDVSFELSFIATVAIIFLSPRLLPFFNWIPWKWLREIVTITSSMYAFALPFVLFRIGNLSLVALPANILIVPLMPVTMIAGFITGFAGLISPVLAIIPGKLAFLLLYFQIGAVALISHLPFAAVAIQNFSLPIALVIYGIFFWIFIKGKGEGEVTNNESKEIHEVRIDMQVLRPKFNFHGLFVILPLVVTFSVALFLYYDHWKFNQNSLNNIHKLLSPEVSASSTLIESNGGFVPDPRTTENNCKINGPYPDHACTPGAVFTDVTVADICVKGYTATVRNVSVNTKKKVFEEYGLAYPQPAGAYEVDHFIPLALGGANDIANLFPEAAAPVPGFHEKDVVEVFLQGEVCSSRATLAAAQRQISTDWLAVYNNIPFEVKQSIKKKYGGSAVQ